MQSRKILSVPPGPRPWQHIRNLDLKIFYFMFKYLTIFIFQKLRSVFSRHQVGRVGISKFVEVKAFQTYGFNLLKNILNTF